MVTKHVTLLGPASVTSRVRAEIRAAEIADRVKRETFARPSELMSAAEYGEWMADACVNANGAGYLASVIWCREEGST